MARSNSPLADHLELNKVDKPLDYFTDVMVDIETTGTSPARHAILQISAVPFRVDTGEVSKIQFNYCLKIPQNRDWQEDTRGWWHGSPERRKILSHIMRYQADPREVMAIFARFASDLADKVRFWSHHPFDWEFLENYFENYYDYPNPFRFRYFRDVESVILGAVFPATDTLHRPPKDQTQAHNAIYDVEYQIQWVLYELQLAHNKPLLLKKEAQHENDVRQHTGETAGGSTPRA